MKHVLIIEDDPEIVRLLQIHLQDLHCTTTAAATGEAGLEHGLQKHYDLIILDIMLPGKDGIAVCQASGQRNAKARY